MFEAFRPMGNTTLIASTAASATIAQPSTGHIQGCMLVNRSTNDAFIAIGVSTATAAIPTTSATAAGMCLPKNTERFIKTPPNFYISAITSAGQADIFITPGGL
ncbi:MAG TPA: hypothetical protein PK020_22070 [Ilumatobacteraceae bacterium]|nr:hypothetical protein [Ilumatobacteraceae bacterium]